MVLFSPLTVMFLLSTYTTFARTSTFCSVPDRSAIFFTTEDAVTKEELSEPPYFLMIPRFADSMFTW